MQTTQPELNLARKWRPKSFNQIIGQDIPVRMLKNGLFLKKFFPVYLFAGQRGCGKTSTARVFGAAVNCHQLESFQGNPEVSIPCLTCASCQAMINGHHPDFIEIDAASHTGVDNVRQIIDSSSYMPLLGQKKIYLIDEAHMLSKAAFNAFLKILEEPPMSVLFILATTETQKIPPTVLSRCFQVVFTPIEHSDLKKHLCTICQNEGITVQENALDLLLAETEGSARDAINLLERVRFSCTHITDDTILSVLGKISNRELYTLFDCALDRQADKLLAHLHNLSYETRSPQILWDMLIQLCRTLVWIKYGAAKSLAPWTQQDNQLQSLAEKCSIARLHAIFQLFWTQEELFFKTNKKHAFLEMVLLQLCEQVNIVDLDALLQTEDQEIRPNTQKITQAAPPPTTSAPMPIKQEKQPEPSMHQNVGWEGFLQKIQTLDDSLLASIFMQAKYLGTDEAHKNAIIQLNSNSKFFKDTLEECKKSWLPIFSVCFPDYRDIIFKAPEQAQLPPQAPRYQTAPPATENIQSRQNSPQAPTRQPMRQPSPPNSYKKNPYAHNNFGKINNSDSKNLQLEAINISDKEAWPVANLIISHFPGKIRKLKEEPSVPASLPSTEADQHTTTVSEDEQL